MVNAHVCIKQDVQSLSQYYTFDLRWKLCDGPIELVGLKYVIHNACEHLKIYFCRNQKCVICENENTQKRY